MFTSSIILINPRIDEVGDKVGRRVGCLVGTELLGLDDEGFDDGWLDEGIEEGRLEDGVEEGGLDF